jgi:hypothetical protein
MFYIIAVSGVKWKNVNYNIRCMTFLNTVYLYLFEDSLFALFGTTVDLFLFSHHITVFGHTLSS